MINNKTLRAQFKTIRTEQKTSAKIGQMVIGFLIIVSATAMLALIVRLVCVGIVTVHHLLGGF